ncbi:MAG: NAD-dependent epimerase/dehydratase family protein [Sciscionella sp.]
MNGTRIVVTGGSGFVGRSVVRALVARGATVTVADRLAFPDAGVNTVLGELTEPGVRERLFAEPCEGVIHLAGITSVLRSVELPAETVAANVSVTAALLEEARKSGVHQFLLASTNAVVGDVGTATITEATPLRPLTPYGATKAACEMLLSGYAGSYEMITTALRFTNIYGPGMEAKDSFVPRMMRAAVGGDVVSVYGDGTQRRDLVHVDDVVAAILAAFDREFCGTAIIGAGRSVSVLDMIAAVNEVTGRELNTQHVEAKAGEMPAVIVDISMAARELGYTPSMSLREGLATVWRDFRSQLAVP